MRFRKLVALVGAGAIVSLLGFPGTAGAAPRDVIQTTDGTITPFALPGEAFANATLRVVTSVRDSEDPAVCASADPPADTTTCRLPPRVSRAFVDFDRDIRLNPNAVARCNPVAVAGQTTQAARAICPTAIVGFGEAVARGGAEVGGPTSAGVVKGEITAFNGSPANTVILHVDLGALGALNLIGALGNSPVPGYGQRLSVTIPATPTALTRFDTTVQRGRYLQARCGPTPFGFRGLFEYGHGQGQDPDGPPGTPWYPASAIGQSTDECIPRCRGHVATHVGTAGHDTILGTAGRDVVVAYGGNDVIRTFGGNDLICAGPGHDRVFAGPGHDVIFGGPGQDRLHGGPGRDVLHGQAGADRLFGGGGADRLFGGPGRDRLFGGPGPDRLFGGGGADRLFGGPGHDRLFGGPGADRLFGGRGNDLLNGGAGFDRCFGGPGRDTYRRCAIRR